MTLRPVLLVVLLHVAAGTAAADPTLDLLTAARRGDVAALRKALAEGAPVNAADPDFAQTALIRAAMFGQRAAAEALLAAKADPNVTSNLARTAPAAAAPVTRFALALGEGQQFSIANNPMLAVSPDGTTLVYVASNQLYLRSMSDLEARAIPGTQQTPSP